MAFKTFFYHKKSLIHIIALLVFTALPISASAAFIPFSPDSAIPLLKKMIERRLPLTMDRDGFTITVKEVRKLSMKWEKSEFEIVCAFNLSRTEVFIMKGSGEVTISGIAIFSPTTNSIGVRLLGAHSLKIEGLTSSINRSITGAVSNSIRGKEFWAGPSSASWAALTKENFSLMFKISLERMLPFTFKTKRSAITFVHLYHLDSYHPGKIYARVKLNGSYKGFIDFDFSGIASVDLALYIDPDNLEGNVRIGKISKLELEHRSVFTREIIGMIIRSKMEDETIRFPLYRKKK
jgi:hypothetical protein